jgi:hypothetical protein
MKNEKGMIKGAAKPTFTPVGAIEIGRAHV